MRVVVVVRAKHPHEQSLAKPRYVRIAGCGCGVLSLLQKEHPECPTRPGEARRVLPLSLTTQRVVKIAPRTTRLELARPPSLLPCPSPDDVRLVVSARETLCQLYAGG